MKAVISRAREISIGWMRFGIALAIVIALVFAIMWVGEQFGVGPPPM